jgi:hypothetical protein
VTGPAELQPAGANHDEAVPDKAVPDKAVPGEAGATADQSAARGARPLMAGQVVRFELVQQAAGVLAGHYRDLRFRQTGAMPQEAIIAMQFLGAMTLLLAVQLIFVLVFDPMIRAALIFEISASYLAQPHTATEAYTLVRSRLWPMVMTNLAIYFISLAGYFACCLPGIIAQLVFMLAGPAVVLEGRFGMDALKRSVELLKWNFIKALLLAGAMFALIVLLGYILMPLTFQFLVPNESIAMFLTRATEPLLLPLGVGAVTLFYYDIRIRKEAIDIQMQVAA